MTRVMLILFFSLSLVGCSYTSKQYNEKHYQTLLCNELSGEMEVILEDRTRVDCLTDEYAIEVDFAKKWAESIGQSLYYAHMTKKEPAIGLIVGKNDSRFLKRLETLSRELHIKVFVIKKKQ
jgi:hypothetical protein